MAGTGGPVGQDGGNVCFEQLQSVEGLGLASETVLQWVATVMSAGCWCGGTSPTVGNLSVIILNAMHASLLRNSRLDVSVT